MAQQTVTTTQFSLTTSLPLTNGWKDFGETYSSPTVTRQGDLVVLEGLVKDGPKTPGSLISQLPVGFRPSKRLIFAQNHHETQVRVDVLPDGQIQYIAGAMPHVWISLSGIVFTTREKLEGLPSGAGGSSSGGSGTKKPCPCPPRWSIPEGSQWRYGPWGGLCTALWQPNGELWMALNPASTNGTCVWKTTDGAAKKLIAGEHIKCLWDNVDRQDLVLTDINTISAFGGTQYQFLREPRVPVPGPAKFRIPNGSKWQYDPWGGQCTAVWQPSGELWMCLNPAATNATCVWKTLNGDWLYFLAGEHIKCLWDNVDRQDLVITDKNTISCFGGTTYQFKRVPPSTSADDDCDCHGEGHKTDPIPVDKGDGNKTVEKDGYDPIKDGGYTPTGTTVVKDGIIHLTEAVNSQFGGIFFNVLPSSDKNISFSFDYFSGNGTGADGFSFFLADGAKHDGKTLGYWGGALGYLPFGTTPGLPFGYLGIGFDEYGTFGNIQGATVPSKDQVVVRGAGNAMTGYKLLANKSVAPLSMDGGWRNAKVEIDFVGASTVITLNMKWYKDKSDTEVDKEVLVFDKVKIDQADVAKPATFRVGLAAATGGANNQHYVKNLKILYRNQ